MNEPKQPPSVDGIRLNDSYREEWLFLCRLTGTSDGGFDYRVNVHRLGSGTYALWWESDVTAHREIDLTDRQSVLRLLIKPALLEVVSQMGSLIWTAADAAGRAKP